MTHKAQSVRTKFHRVVSETLRSIVIEVSMPGTGVRQCIRVPKTLCRNWTNETVDIYSGYFSQGATVVNVADRIATQQEFDEAGDDVLRMPPRYSTDFKQWIVDEVMTAYTQYERLV